MGQGKSNLHKASRDVNVEVVQYLIIQNEAKVQETENTTNFTPLHLASQEGHLQIAKLLIETGRADVNAIDKWRRTPLHLASEFGHVEIVQLLVNHGAKLNALTYKE